MIQDCISKEKWTIKGFSNVLIIRNSGLCITLKMKPFVGRQSQNEKISATFSTRSWRTSRNPVKGFAAVCVILLIVALSFFHSITVGTVEKSSATLAQITSYPSLPPRSLCECVIRAMLYSSSAAPPMPHKAYASSVAAQAPGFGFNSECRDFLQCVKLEHKWPKWLFSQCLKFTFHTAVLPVGSVDNEVAV